MKSALKITVILSFVLASAGCHKMQIHNGPRAELTSFEQGEWHHDGVVGLVEFSPPMDLSKQCPGGTWQSVQVQRSFIQGLVQAITFGLYTPWDTNVQCGKR